MKYFTKQVNERLKLFKDTKIRKGINDLSINDICKDKVFTICMVNLKKDSFDLFKFIQNDDTNKPTICDWYVQRDPKRDSKGIYNIYFKWSGDDWAQRFCCYTDPEIESSFLWFISETKSPMYIIFNNENEANQFIDNYDRLYKDEVKRIDEEYFAKNK